MEKLQILLEKLNSTDECTFIEAKRGLAIDRSIMETVCAFSNEPQLGGGYILLGVEKLGNGTIGNYEVTGVTDPDKLQADLSSRCASEFNCRVRPRMELQESHNGQYSLVIFVPEVPEGQKPVYFKSEGWPIGGYRRIGSTDQGCTDDDLEVFKASTDSFESGIIQSTSLDDINLEALQLYRKFRSNVNPEAQELKFNDEELLKSLGCLKSHENKWCLTQAGLIVFGKIEALRRLSPMVRVDYIRVSGTEWVADPEKKFKTIDLKGSLIELVQKIFNLINDELPKNFKLNEGDIQAENNGVPSQVIREAIVNSFIHRSFREHQPILVVRYDNRIEIINPGFSLKQTEDLGEPGSRNRNPLIASIFHETNLAETKGSGIKSMRKFMAESDMFNPTFESSHTKNQFIVRLVLGQINTDENAAWLNQFRSYDLSDGQKLALLFIRECGALDSTTYGQLTESDKSQVTKEVSELIEADLLNSKRSKNSLYYLPGPSFYTPKIEDAVKTELSNEGTVQAGKNVTVITTNGSETENIGLKKKDSK